MSKDIRCPYCEEWIDINHDDGVGYAEDETHQQYCEHCGKYFVYTTSISYNYTAEKADCLNNEGKHTYEKTRRFPVVIGNKVLVRCTQCDEERDIDVKEAYLYGYKPKDLNQWKGKSLH